MIVPFISIFVLYGCNSGTGTTAADGGSNHIPDSANTGHGQTGTAMVQLQGDIPYNKNFCYVVTLGENGVGKEETSQICGGSEIKTSTTIHTDTNISWRFGMYFTASTFNENNTTLYTVTNDPGCPTNLWNNQPVTADLQCYMGDNFNIQCGLCSGNCSYGIDLWLMHTPAGSEPHAIFYISQTSATNYHVSCSYTWN